jgi:hypothetical protein
LPELREIDCFFGEKVMALVKSTFIGPKGRTDKIARGQRRKESALEKPDLRVVDWHPI